MLSYSHENLTQIIGNVVRVSFPAINLPDNTSNEPNSHGYFQYKVKLISGLSIGTTISNTANIFFDFNAPIRTNTTVNTTSNLSSVASINSPLDFAVYPNPVIQNLRISFALQKTSDVKISLYNSFGQHIRTLLDSKNAAGLVDLTFPMEGISQGIYYLRFEVDGGIRTKMLLKF